MKAGIRVGLLVLALVGCESKLAAQVPASGDDGQAADPPVTRDIFTPPLASPTEPANMLRFAGGGQYDFGLMLPFALYTVEGSATTWQVGVQPAIVARLGTRDSQLTLKAADFRLGVPVAFRHGNWSGRVELFHVSSHRGADFADETSGPSFSYSREVLQALVAYGRDKRWRIYAGPSVALHRHPSTGRAGLQAGTEWFPVSYRRARLYLAEDVETRQEAGWQMNYSLEPGTLLTTRRGEPVARLGAWFYRGQEPFGQFFRLRETVVGGMLTLELRPALKSLVTRKR